MAFKHEGSANAEQAEYEPPAIRQLGSVQELTQNAGVGRGDASSHIASPSTSDRRLKSAVREVDTLDVLQLLGRL